MMQKPLKIAILAHSLRVTGGKTIGASVLSALQRVAPEHEYLITVPADSDFENCTRELPRVDLIACDAPNRLARMRFDRKLVRETIPKFTPDVIYALSGQGIAKAPCPQALFPQDAHLFYPAKHFAGDTFKAKLVKRFHRMLLARCLKSSQLIFCQTPVVAERIRKTYGYNGKSTVVYGAPPDSLQTNGAAIAAPPEYAEHNGKLKIACISAFYGHKNVDAIADAVEQFPDDFRDIVFFLTVAAQQHPAAAEFINRIASEKFRGRIVNLGQRPLAELKPIYANADAMMLPTLLETFGLPYVEAMSFGLPILTSDLDFAHAVCGDAALFFDPWSPQSIRDQIVRFRDDAKLRASLAAKSRERLTFFARSWDEITETMIRDLEQLVAEAKR